MPQILLPTLNACLNFTAGVFLISGWIAIKSGNRERHKRMMVCALITSSLFLCSYLTYHYMYGSTKYPGEGGMRIIYFTILLTHTPLAMLIVPFAIAAVIFAVKGQYDKHTKITRWLMPTWLYVSATGVIIYLMLYVI